LIKMERSIGLMDGNWSKLIFRSILPGTESPAPPGISIENAMALLTDESHNLGPAVFAILTPSTGTDTVPNAYQRPLNVIKGLDSAVIGLLDELGAGTDPQEGSALARAVLSALLSRKITCMVATHYPELKTFAHATRGVLNASLEFDVETLKPTYHLTMGLPGRSNALAIAERLGLDRDIIEDARHELNPRILRAGGFARGNPNRSK